MAEVAQDRRSGRAEDGTPGAAHEKTITRFEYQVLRTIGKRDKQYLVQLTKRLKERLGGHFLRPAFKGVKFANYVGVIPLPGGRVIEILPKIDKGDAKREARARECLLYMLAAAGYVPWSPSTQALLDEKTVNFLEIYIQIFAEEVRKLLVRGLLHDYITHEDELRCLRGKLLFPQQLRLTARCTPRFAVRYQEYTPDTPLNRILKDVTTCLRGLSRWEENLRLLRQIEACLDEVNLDRRHTVEDVDRVRQKLDRKTQAYRMVLSLCRTFLANRTPEAAKAGRTELPAILFDMNRLFERFIGQAVRRVCGTNHEVILQERDRFLLQDQDHGGKGALQLQADIVVKGADLRPLVIDTKWKECETDPDPGDLYQMAGYALGYGADRAVLVYPRRRGERSKGACFRKYQFAEETKKQFAVDVSRGAENQPAGGA